MKYVITAPNGAYKGVSAGVAFLSGKAVTEDEKSIDWFRENGYSVELMEDEKSMEDGNKTKAMKVKKVGAEEE